MMGGGVGGFLVWLVGGVGRVYLVFLEDLL